MSDWRPYNQGRSLGMQGAEGNPIVRDEDHPLGARMTIKQGDDYVSVSCSITGKIDHTRFFREMKTAEREYEAMQKEMARVLKAISTANFADIRIWEAISDFVLRFP